MSDAKPDLKRDGTVQLGSKEGESVIIDAQNKPDEDIQTVDDEIDKGDGDKSEEPSAKKARLSKDITMVDTIKAGKDFLGNEKLGESRSETSARKEKPSTKRVSTMTKTALEGEELLKREGHTEATPDSGRRQTRSQTRGGTTPSPAKPPAKRSASTPSTPKDGNEVQKRGRKGRPKKSEKKDEDQKESAEETTTEETKDETEDVKEENQEAHEEEEEEEEEAHAVEDEQHQDGNEQSAEQTEEKTD